MVLLLGLSPRPKNVHQPTLYWLADAVIEVIVGEYSIFYLAYSNLLKVSYAGYPFDSRNIK